MTSSSMWQNWGGPLSRESSMVWPLAQNEYAWKSGCPLAPFAPSSAHLPYFSVLPRCHGTNLIGSLSLICWGHASLATHCCPSSLPIRSFVSVSIAKLFFLSLPFPQSHNVLCGPSRETLIAVLVQFIKLPIDLITKSSLQGDMYSYLAHTSDIVNNCMLNEAIKFSCVSTGPSGFLSRKEN